MTLLKKTTVLEIAKLPLSLFSVTVAIGFGGFECMDKSENAPGSIQGGCTNCSLQWSQSPGDWVAGEKCDPRTFAGPLLQETLLTGRSFGPFHWAARVQIPRQNG